MKFSPPQMGRGGESFPSFQSSPGLVCGSESRNCLSSAASIRLTDCSRGGRQCCPSIFWRARPKRGVTAAAEEAEEEQKRRTFFQTDSSSLSLSLSLSCSFSCSELYDSCVLSRPLVGDCRCPRQERCQGGPRGDKLGRAREGWIAALRPKRGRNSSVGLAFDRAKRRHVNFLDEVERWLARPHIFPL